MDPLSISASIAGLISLTEIAVKNGFRLIKDSTDAEDIVKKLFYELNALYGVLQSLFNVVSVLETADTPASYSHGAQSHLITACLATIIKVEKILEKVAAKRNKNLQRVKQRLRWPLNADETLGLLNEIERHKSSISLAVTVDELYEYLLLLKALLTEDYQAYAHRYPVNAESDQSCGI